MSYTPYGGGYGTAGSTPFGYPTSRPPTHGSSAINHLPSISTPQSNILRLPQRGSGLQLSVKALPNSPRIQATLPRERPVQYQRLCSSDSKALDYTRSPSQTLSHVRRNTTDNSVQLHDRVKSLPSQFHRPQEELDFVSPPLHQPRPPSSLVRPTLPQSPSRQPYSGDALPPIVVPTLTVELPISQKESDDQNSDQDDDDTGSDTSSDSELFSEGSEAPPSRPGFESDAEQSGYFLNIPFPDVNQSVSYPATLIQDHAQLDTDRFAAGTNTLGLSPRVDNIVRGFRIHGPLDRELLQKALNQVVSLHPLLKANFQRTRDRLYIQTPVTGESTFVNIDSPIIGHEQPQDLIVNARRKIFQLEMKTNLVQSSGNDSNYDNDIIVNAFSLTSVAGSDCSDQSKSPTIVRSHHKRVSFAPPSQTMNTPGTNTTIKPNTYPLLPSIGQNTFIDDTISLLVRAKLSSKGLHEHILMLSFPRIVCDFWSSCLFSHQLSNAYTKLEKTASYRPSLAASRIESKRQAVIIAHERMKNGGSTRRKDAASRLLQKRAQVSQQVKNEIYIPPFPSQLHFPQIAQRENQLLLMLSREKLWGFWESMVTAIIQRQRGPNRVKVVPPIRIPSGLGEKFSKTRPQTSKLRPLTASRNRPQTAKRELGLRGDVGMSREAMAGPKIKFQYIKIEDHICKKFKQYLPEDYLSHIMEDEVLSLMCLGAYALMLGKCCRGWGTDERMVRECGDGASGNLIEDSRTDFPTIASETNKTRPQFPRDPLQKYKIPGSSQVPRPVVLTESSSPDTLFNVRRASITGKLDLGSFLIGMEISLRHSEPQKTQGVFGPLTNDGGIRVNLDPRETFSGFLLSLWRSILLARKHGHFPFPIVAEEVGLMHGLPIRFSYLYRRDIVQLTNPNDFYFPETAMGVEGQGLARFGSTCYLTPLNGKMDDNCHFELLLWESYDGDGICGGIHYQPQVIKTELVESFSRELCRMLTVIAEDPCRFLVDLAQEIQPPFMNSGREKKYKMYRKSAAAGLP